MHAYLCSGNRILCTYWDSHSKSGSLIHNIFLHSHRQDYNSLKLFKTNEWKYETHSACWFHWQMLNVSSYTHIYMYTWYLCTGSKLPCNHWDTHTEWRNKNFDMFLHSDRQGYSLQRSSVQYVSWTNCSRVFMCLVVHCSYLCAGSRILCTHWDSHSRRRKRNCYTFLHSNRMDCKSVKL